MESTLTITPPRQLVLSSLLVLLLLDFLFPPYFSSFTFFFRRQASLRGFLGYKRPDREATYSPPSNAEVKNAWSNTSTPPWLCLAWCSVNLYLHFCVSTARVSALGHLTQESVQSGRTSYCSPVHLSSKCVLYLLRFSVLHTLPLRIR